MGYAYEAMVSRHLDVRNRAGVEWQCLCPFHEDTSPSFSVNVSKGLFICYACGAKGNGDALARKLGARPIERLPESIENLIAKIEQFEKDVQPTPSKRVSGDVWAARFQIGAWEQPWRDRLGDEFTVGLAKQFALGYDYIQHALVVPIFDWNGSAEGGVRRRLGAFDGPKYLYTKGFKTSQHLYGAWQVRCANPSGRPKKVAVVEGTIDALSLWAVGIQAVALLGSQVSAAQKRLFERLDAVEYVVMTDRDAAGAKAAVQLVQALHKSGSLVSHPTDWPSGCKDVAEMTPSDRIKSFESSLNALTH